MLLLFTMVVEYKKCRHCGSKDIVKNGHTPEGVQRYKCKDCCRCSKEKHTPRYTDEEREKILRCCHGKSSMRGIRRTFGVSWQTLRKWLKKKAAEAPSLAGTLLPAKPSNVLELDGLWSFVGKKKNKCRVWLALCRETRQVVGYAFGDRGFLTCNALFESIPEPYRKCRTFSDFWDTYDAVFPNNVSVPKESGETAHIERLDNTLRQRVGRLVRKTLSFSKDLETHIRTIVDFIKSYNLCIVKSTAY